MNLLIVDDESSFRLHLKHVFERQGYSVAEAKSGFEAIEKAKQTLFDVILLDIILPDIDGLEVLKQLHLISPFAQVIMMTGNATVENAIASMKLGAYDYLVKPFDFEELSILVKRAQDLARLKREREAAEHEKSFRSRFEEFIGQSEHTRQVMQLVERVAPTNSTVLITGETGTGKELIARAIYRKSVRSDKPFIVINCSAMQDTLLESELFGYIKGAFTGAVKNKSGLIEVVNSGTLFLDEIGDVSPEFQTKLLRFLESGEYRPLGSTHTYKSDVRIIAATNRDLKQLMQQDQFREDLYYRLNVFNIHLLPLRERPEDIPILVDHFLSKSCFALKKCVKKCHPQAMKILQSYHWPGNVRELENVLERAVILSDGQEIKAEDLPADIKQTSFEMNKTTPLKLADLERQHILNILQKTGGNKTETARLLGISKKSLYHKPHKYGVM
ncbi:MAG: sigma-54-dependent Fis family transcriptional regulator [Caldisericaceae bacterium]|nr:sigma-54-dependent Fis family transcriptional regulator [Caldisericaceae bacterium]